jgi:hypothetical protein
MQLSQLPFTEFFAWGEDSHGQLGLACL